MNQTSPSLSVVIPIYNAEKFIEKCVESIIKQTYIDWELLLINDGSTDKSLDICQRYAEQDLRIVCINKQNGGVSSARNVGIEVAKGKFITFVDADDWLEADHFTHIMCVSEDMDLVVNGHKEINTNSVVEKRITGKNFYTLDELKADYDRLYPLSLINFPWSKRFKCELIKNQRFDEKVKLGEDYLFNMQYLSKCSSIAFLLSCDYCYNKTNNSSATKKFREEDFCLCVKVYNEAKKFRYADNSFNGYDIIDETLCEAGIYTIMSLCAHKPNEYKNTLKAWLNFPEFEHVCRGKYNFAKTIQLMQFLCKYKMTRTIRLFLNIKPHIRRLLKKN